MPFAIFTPTSKIHLQRNVMRETDQRLATYSKRGIVLNVVIFTLSLFVGEFYLRNPLLTVVLAIGLILTTLLRGYFLFRFEDIYAQGANRWRNLFFLSCLIGAVWWGFILACITYANGGLYHEAPIFWLYTAAFFAGSIYIFAPFERFLTIYMFVAFIPCSLVAIFLFEPMSILYGLIMMTLYWLLCRQGHVIGRNYWDKIQANYELMRRANDLEAEKITTESSLNTRDTLFSNITLELKSSMQEILGSLQLLKYSKLQNEEEQLVILSEQKAQQQINLLKNIAELSDVSTSKLVLEQSIIDPRSHIEQALDNVCIIAHKKNIELYSSFATDFPLRVRADTERLEQLISNLVASACEFCRGGALLISSSFRFEENPGKLKISIINRDPIRTPEAIESLGSAFSAHHATDIHLGLSLSIVKGLAQYMGGDAGADYRDDGSLIFWVSVCLEATAETSKTSQSMLKLSGKKIMLYRPPQMIADVFKTTLEDYGLLVDVVQDEAEAIDKLELCHNDQAYQLIIIYTQLNDISSLALSKTLAEHEQLNTLPQIITLSKMQAKEPEVEQHFLNHTNLQVVYKPISYRDLKKKIKDFLIESKKNTLDSEKEEFLNGKNVLLFQKEDIDAAIIKAMLKKLGCQVTTAFSLEDSLESLSEKPYDAFISESHLAGINLKDFIDEARKVNDALHKDDYKIPVLGYTSHELDGEEAQCLACGMEYYIDSPVNIDDLRAILRRFVGRAEHMSKHSAE